MITHLLQPGGGDSSPSHAAGRPPTVRDVPGAWEFEQAARAVRARRDELAGALAELTRGASALPVDGGPVADVLRTALDVSVVNARTAITHLDALASVCARRAVVCSEHAAALVQWQRRLDAWETSARTTPRPVRPVAPAPWVEPR